MYKYDRNKPDTTTNQHTLNRKPNRKPETINLNSSEIEQITNN